MKNIVLVSGLFLAGLLSGCATPTVVEVKQSGDAALSCAQIKGELDVADKYLKAAKKDRTATGTNVAAAIFFLPGLLGTYVNTEEAINAAKERSAVLMKFAERKKCNLEDTVAAPVAVPASALVDEGEHKPALAVAKSDSSVKAMSPVEIQTALLALGYPIGVADGAMGKKTIDAIRAFQRKNNLVPSGVVNPATMALLRQ